MLSEPTTLAAVATAIAEAVEHAGCDVPSVFARAGLDIQAMQRPGARYPVTAMTRLWKAAGEQTHDPCIGLTAALKLRPQSLHALGLSWLSSRTLLDGLQRMARYERIASTALRLKLVEQNEQIKLVVDRPASAADPAPEAVDALLAVIVRMCRLMTSKHFAPLLVTFARENQGPLWQYVDTFQAPVLFSKDENALYFDAQTLRQPTPAGNEELARQTDQIAERYLATLDPQRVQDRVRDILLTLLPSGDVDQHTVAKTMNRSVSSLQRQLKAEGATYRQVLDQTRQTLAQQLVREERYSLGQIAYLLGFSDQANFSRAFKRWTGEPPARARGA
jgi:AraC-like DNA-binding protein